MKKLFVFSFFTILSLFISASPVFAKAGCCSHHGGVQANGCGCNDGSPLSSTCSPYYACTAGDAAPEVKSEQTTATIAPVKKIIVIPTKKLTPTLPPYVETENDKKKLFKVVRVVDGDTIAVNIRGKIETVRLLAIDTPETVDPRKPVQCFGKEATNKMISLVSGKYVKLVDDKSLGNKDKYNRLLRYVYDGSVFVNQEMVAQGYAFSYKQYPTKYLGKFNKLEQQAREKNLGLWNSCK